MAQLDEGHRTCRHSRRLISQPFHKCNRHPPRHGADYPPPGSGGLGAAAGPSSSPLARDTADCHAAQQADELRLRHVQQAAGFIDGDEAVKQLRGGQLLGEMAGREVEGLILMRGK